MRIYASLNTEHSTSKSIFLKSAPNDISPLFGSRCAYLNKGGVVLEDIIVASWSFFFTMI